MKFNGDRRSGECRSLPMTSREMLDRDWDELDVLIITGDAYVDHHSFGAAVIGRVLEARGFRVGIVAQPDWRTPESLKVMGRPRLFCGITSGNLDSMLAHYTAARHKRDEDAYSEGGKPGRRPNHASIVYAQLARQAFPDLPIIQGGVEASLRRSVHYDFWQDRLRPSILLNSKADLLVYGMGEQAVREVAERLSSGNRDLAGIRGTAYLLGANASKELKYNDCTLLPSWEECEGDRKKLLHLTKLLEREQNPFCARRLVQFHGERALVIEPPAYPLPSSELDLVYGLPFTRKPHPSYRESIPAYEMVKDSVTVVRGCAGGCSFCSLGLHQGKMVTSRSEASILGELAAMSGTGEFRGTVSDLGGPTANLYGCANGLDTECRQCRRPSCFFPALCRHFSVDEKRIVNLYRASRKVPGVHHVHISSGIRMDLAMMTPGYLRELVRHHVPGHLKVAPEHLHDEVLRRMRKSSKEVFFRFLEFFEKESASCGKEQYLVPYFISNFPGCTETHMAAVEDFLRARRWQLQQVQDFIPLPMTVAAAMYYTGLDLRTEKPLYVSRGYLARRKQKSQLLLRGPAKGKRGKGGISP